MTDQRFGQVAVNLGFLDASKLDAAIRLQKEIRAADQKRFSRLGYLLAKAGYLTEAQVLKVLEVQSIGMQRCPKCRRQYNIRNVDPGRSYLCPADSTTLETVDQNSLKSILVAMDMSGGPARKSNAPVNRMVAPAGTLQGGATVAPAPAPTPNRQVAPPGALRGGRSAAPAPTPSRQVAPPGALGGPKTPLPPGGSGTPGSGVAASANPAAPSHQPVKSPKVRRSQSDKPRPVNLPEGAANVPKSLKPISDKEEPHHDLPPLESTAPKLHAGAESALASKQTQFGDLEDFVDDNLFDDLGEYDNDAMAELDLGGEADIYAAPQGSGPADLGDLADDAPPPPPAWATDGGGFDDDSFEIGELDDDDRFDATQNPGVLAASEDDEPTDSPGVDLAANITPGSLVQESPYAGLYDAPGGDAESAPSESSGGPDDGWGDPVHEATRQLRRHADNWGDSPAPPALADGELLSDDDDFKAANADAGAELAEAAARHEFPLSEDSGLMPAIDLPAPGVIGDSPDLADATSVSFPDSESPNVILPPRAPESDELAHLADATSVSFPADEPYRRPGSELDLEIESADGPATAPSELDAPALAEIGFDGPVPSPDEFPDPRPDADLDFEIEDAPEPRPADLGLSSSGELRHLSADSDDEVEAGSGANMGIPGLAMDSALDSDEALPPLPPPDGDDDAIDDLEPVSESSDGDVFIGELKPRGGTAPISGRIAAVPDAAPIFDENGDEVIGGTGEVPGLRPLGNIAESSDAEDAPPPPLLKSGSEEGITKFLRQADDEFPSPEDAGLMPFDSDVPGNKDDGTAE